jgi:DNA-binding MarR family transcriptional regulator
MDIGVVADAARLVPGCDAGLFRLRGAVFSLVTSPDTSTLNARQLGVLLVICSASAPVSIGQLKALLGVPGAGVTRAADRLEEFGLALRSRDLLDGRGLILSPTEEGRELVRTMVRWAPGEGEDSPARAVS